MDKLNKISIEGRGGKFIKVEVDGKLEERIVFPPGAIIMAQGEPPDVFYWVMAGEIEIIQDGIPVAKCGPGDFVGEIAFQRLVILDKKEAVRTATARTLTKVVLISLSGNIFESLLDSSKIPPKIGLFRKLFIQAIKREDDLIDENSALKQKMRDMQRQLDQFRAQIMNLRGKIKVLQSSE